LEVEIPKISADIAKKIQEFETSVLLPLRARNFLFNQDIKNNELSFPVSGILTLSDCTDISRPLPVTSHRKLSGPFIVIIKKILMKIARPGLKFFFRRQIFFNENVVAMAHTVVAMEARINYLESLLSRQTSNEENTKTN
jgi:hypothetical protein